MKRLGEVVIGAGVDAVDSFLPTAARGQYQHWHRHIRTAPRTQNCEPVFAWQPEVEDCGIDALDQAEVLGIDAVVCDIHRVAGIVKCLGKLFAKSRIIFNNEHSHGLDAPSLVHCLKIVSSRTPLILTSDPVRASIFNLTTRPSGTRSSSS